MRQLNSSDTNDSGRSDSAKNWSDRARNEIGSVWNMISGRRSSRSNIDMNSTIRNKFDFRKREYNSRMDNYRNYRGSSNSTRPRF